MGADERPAVDEEGGRARHPEAAPLFDVLLHGRLVLAVAQALLERGDVQPHLPGVGLQIVRTRLRRVGVEQIVTGPEFPLLVRAPGRLVRLACLRVQANEQEVPMEKRRTLTTRPLKCTFQDRQSTHVGSPREEPGTPAHLSLRGSITPC